MTNILSRKHSKKRMIAKNKQTKKPSTVSGRIFYILPIEVDTFYCKQKRKNLSKVNVHLL